MRTVVVGALIDALAAFSQQGPCYKLVNATTHEVVVNYQYPGNVILMGGHVQDKFSPGSELTYCYPSYSATANIATQIRCGKATGRWSWAKDRELYRRALIEW